MPPRRRVPVLPIIGCIVAAGFLACSVGQFLESHEMNRALRELRPEDHQMSLHVDLSEPGSFRGDVTQAIHPVSGLLLILEVTPGISSPDQLHTALAGFEGQVILADSSGAVRYTIPLDETSFTISTSPDAPPRFHQPFSRLGQRQILNGTYRFTLEVIRPAPALHDLPQQLVFFPYLFGFEYVLTQLTFVGAVILFGLGLIVLAVSLFFLRRRLRATAGRAPASTSPQT